VIDRAFPPLVGLGLGLGHAESGEPCCASCAEGKSCEGCMPKHKAPRCSEPKAPISVPGSTSFPVGFGQSAQTLTSSVPVSAAVGWAVPLTIGLISIAAGFGLAYVIRSK